MKHYMNFKNQRKQSLQQSINNDNNIGRPNISSVIRHSLSSSLFTVCINEYIMNKLTALLAFVVNGYFYEVVQHKCFYTVKLCQNYLI